jgi:hypothetical protein
VIKELSNVHSVTVLTHSVCCSYTYSICECTIVVVSGGGANGVAARSAKFKGRAK